MDTSRAQLLTGDTLASRRLSRGVEYRHFIDKRGPFDVHLVRVSLRRPEIELRALRAKGELKGRERPTDMVRRVSSDGGTVLAAVNADFFELKTGENENNQVIGGEWWKGLKVTDSPYDTYDNTHIQFGIDATRKPVMDRFMFEGTAWAHGVATPIITENFNPAGKPEGTALYTSRFGDTTPRDTTRQTAEAALIAAGKKGDTVIYVRRGAVAATSGSSIPRDGAILAAYGAGARIKEVESMAEGDTVRGSAHDDAAPAITSSASLAHWRLAADSEGRTHRRDRSPDGRRDHLTKCRDASSADGDRVFA